MKKIFEQPELQVVRMNNRDIVTESIGAAVETATSGTNDAPDRFRDWDEY